MLGVGSVLSSLSLFLSPASLLQGAARIILSSKADYSTGLRPLETARGSPIVGEGRGGGGGCTEFRVSGKTSAAPPNYLDVPLS